MKTIIGLLAATIGGSAGWWLGSQIGIISAVILSGVGSGIGMYAGQRFVRNR